MPIALIYLIIAVLWEFLSDAPLLLIFQDPDDAALATVVKDALFAVGTAVLLFVLVRRVEERTQEIERRRRIAEGLAETLAVLNSNRSLEGVLKFIVRQAIDLLGADGGAIYRLDADAGVLRPQSAQGIPGEYITTAAIPVGQKAVGVAVQNRCPETLSDLAAEARALTQDPTLRRLMFELAQHFHAVLAVPIVAKDEVYGGISLYYARQHAFSDEERELATVFGNHAALAVENERLMESVERAAVAAERTRLARDLHDAVTQTLFSTSLIAEVLPELWRIDPDEGRRRLEELRQLTVSAQAEMRTLLLELRPTALNESPLGELLRHLTAAVSGRARLEVALSVESDDPLPADVHITFYRIAQEALNNVAKHARATQVMVTLCAQPERALLEIRDNGRGFDPGDVLPDHLGLGIMRERIESIGAVLEIDSAPGQGTQVSVLWDQRQEGQSDGRHTG